MNPWLYALLIIGANIVGAQIGWWLVRRRITARMLDDITKMHRDGFDRAIAEIEKDQRRLQRARVDAESRTN